MRSRRSPIWLIHAVTECGAFPGRFAKLGADGSGLGQDEAREGEGHGQDKSPQREDDGQELVDWLFGLLCSVYPLPEWRTRLAMRLRLDSGIVGSLEQRQGP